MTNPLPWQPLFTIERLGSNNKAESGEFSHAIPEITVHGLLAVWTGSNKAESQQGFEAAIGDTESPL